MKKPKIPMEEMGEFEKAWPGAKAAGGFGPKKKKSPPLTTSQSHSTKARSTKTKSCCE